MPYKKKAPAKRTKKAVGGALSAAQKRLLGQAQAGAVKKGAGAITKQIVGMTRKYGDQRKAAAAPAKRKAPAKRPNLGRIKVPAGTKAPLGRGTKGPAKRSGIAMSKTARQTLAQRAAAKRRSQSKARAGLGRDQKRLLSEAQKFAIKRGKGTKAINNYTKKYGLTKAAKQAAMNKLRKRVGLKPRTTTGRPTTGSLKQRITSRSGTVAQRRARALAARRRAAAAARRGRPANTGPTRRIPRRPGTGGRMTPAQRRARLLAARRRMAAMKRRAPTRRPNTRSQNLAARRATSTRRRSRAGLSRRVGAPTSRRGRPSTATRQRRFFGGLIAGIRKATKRKNASPLRARLTGVKRSAQPSALNKKIRGSSLKKRGILGKTRTAVGKKLVAGSKISKSTYKGRGIFGAIKAKKKSTGTGIRGITYWNSKGKNKVTSRPGGIFGRMGRPSRPASGGMRRVGGRLVMGKAMTAPKRMIKSPTRPTIIKVPKTKYGKNTGTDPYKKAMNKAMKM